MSEEKKDGDNGQNTETEPAQAPPQVPPQAQKPAKSKIMDAEDRLRSENMQLKLMNLGLQEEAKLRELRALRMERSELQQAYIVMRKELETKYDVDLSKMEVRAGDGAIIPSGSTPLGHLR